MGPPPLVLAAGATTVVTAFLLLGRSHRVRVLGVLFVAATVAGTAAAAREEATRQADVPPGSHELAGRMLTDPMPGRSGFVFLLDPARLRRHGEWVGWKGPRLAVETTSLPEAAAAEPVIVRGRVRARSGSWRGDPVAGWVSAHDVESLGRAGDPLFLVGNALRRRVEGVLGHRPEAAAALVSGFLIGDVRNLPAADAEALRRAGLTHFVAVSGSNVALFLAAWWLATAPLAGGPRRRAVVGLVGLAVFVVVTRWEPSVVRAATMAALVLAGRIGGVPLSPLTALGGAVTLLLLVSPELAGDVGFQLSVAATLGVLVGAGVPGALRPRWVFAPLAATAAAQIAVAPLILIHFGSVPLLAPVTNLVAGPLVMAATTVGGLAVLVPATPLVGLALLVAEVVLGLARMAAAWPQLDLTGMLVVAATVAMAAHRRLRPLVAIGAAVAVAGAVAIPGRPPREPTAIFLDVGQGDAILLRGPRGESILVDGGPDEAVLASALRRHGVHRLDLMVVSHGHADHVTGLLAAIRQVPVGALWWAEPHQPAPQLDELIVAAGRQGIPTVVPRPGWSARVGAFRLDVLGPRRRYDSLNDGSLVLQVEAGGRSVLLPGDIEVIAQAELGPRPVDVLKVPHQGAATSDLRWLAASAGAVAVVSVGPNPFGHPAPSVIDTLARQGTEVLRTDREGDIVVPLGG